MLIAESSITTTASQKAVWEVWSDVKNWSTWDSDVISCQMTGQFQKDAKIVLKPKGGPKVNVEITECVDRSHFVSRSAFPLNTSLDFRHTIEKQEGGKIKITHRVELRGCLTFLFYCILGKSIQRGLPSALENLARLAEKAEKAEKKD